MRNLREIDCWRDVKNAMRIYGSTGDERNGLFRVPCPATAATLTVIASSGGGWDHVSVSLPNRIPNWTEMEFVKRAFFADDETAMQLHVPTSQHINFHVNCLHLWRPLRSEIPLPPRGMVA